MDVTPYTSDRNDLAKLTRYKSQRIQLELRKSHFDCLEAIVSLDVIYHSIRESNIFLSIALHKWAFCVCVCMSSLYEYVCVCLCKCVNVLFMKYAIRRGFAFEWALLERGVCIDIVRTKNKEKKKTTRKILRHMNHIDSFGDESAEH